MILHSNINQKYFCTGGGTLASISSTLISNLSIHQNPLPQTDRQHPSVRLAPLDLPQSDTPPFSASVILAQQTQLQMQPITPASDYSTQQPQLAPSSVIPLDMTINEIADYVANRGDHSYQLDKSHNLYLLQTCTVCRYHPEIKTIRLYSPGNDTSQLYLEIIYKDGRPPISGYFIHDQHFPLLDLLDTLIERMAEDEYELDRSHSDTKPALNAHFWSKEWNIVPEVQTTYQTIHRAFLRAIQEFYIRPTPPIILDCGSGKGDLLHQLYLAFPNALIAGIERDPVSCHKARMLNPQTEIICCDLLDLEKMRQSLQPDILCFSGILTQQVLDSQQTAKKILRQGLAILAPHGLILISGYAENFLSRDDFERMGCRVLKTFDFENDTPIWVIQKNNTSV